MKNAFIKRQNGIRKLAYPIFVRCSGKEGKAGNAVLPKGQNDSPPDTLRHRGDYLYDKGENDERFSCVNLFEECPHLIYKYILLYSDKKVNDFSELFQKLFFFVEIDI